MNKVKHLIKLLLKCVYINNIFQFHIGKGSGIGAFSRIIFSSEGTAKANQSIRIGDNAGVGRNCELHVWGNNHILIKDNSTLNDGCKLLGDVVIERHCLFSANIFASSGNHYAQSYPSLLIKDQDALILSSESGRKEHSKPIRVEEDCWIGYGVFIKQGVYIGRGAVIGANTVITKDVSPYSIQVGSPNREVKRRLEFTPLPAISSNSDEHLPYFYRGFDQKADALKISRKENVIFVHDEALVVLAGDSYDTLNFSGFVNKNVKDLEVVVLWQGKYEWTLKINAGNFDFSLLISTSNIALSEQALALVASLGNEMNKYNLICFCIKNRPNVSNSLGLSTIALTRSRT